MKRLFYLFLLLTLNFATQAQRSYVRKAVEKDIERKQAEKHAADKQKGEDAVDERLDAWDESDKNRREKIEPFPTMSYTMDMEFPDKPKNNGSITYHFKGYNCATEMLSDNNKQAQTRTIMNFKEGKSIMLTTDKKGRKTGMEMDLKMIDWAARAAVKKDQDMIKKKDASITPTSEYKTIEGYKCRKYLYENEKYKSDLWVTTDVKFDYMKLNKAMYSVYGTQSYTSNEYYKAGIKGVMIQIHTYPTDGRMQESIMTMKNINMGSVDDSKFSTDGYKIEKMPSIRDMWNSHKEEN